MVPEDFSVSGLSGNSDARPIPDYVGRYEVQDIVYGDDIREVRLLADNRYIVAFANGIDATGRYFFEAAGNRIVLERTGKPAWVFFAGKNGLKLLDPGKQQGWLFARFPD